MEDIARQAAVAWSSEQHPHGELIRKGGDYQTYLDSRVHCASAAQPFRFRWFVKEHGDVPESFSFTQRDNSDGTALTTQPDVEFGGGESPYTESCSRIPPDIHVSCTTDRSVDILAHKAILLFASPVLAGSISQLTDFHDDGLPIIFIPEPVPILRHLIAFCYGVPLSACTPGPEVELGTRFVNADLLVNVVHAAGRYQMQSVIAVARAILQPYLANDPIQAYYVAVACKWREEAAEAAMHAAFMHDPGSAYVSAMELCDGKSFVELVRVQALSRTFAAYDMGAHREYEALMLAADQSSPYAVPARLQAPPNVLDRTGLGLSSMLPLSFGRISSVTLKEVMKGPPSGLPPQAPLTEWIRGLEKESYRVESRLQFRAAQVRH